MVIKSLPFVVSFETSGLYKCENSTGDKYEGRPINKLQNGIILLIFKI